ncbi:MAG TPA: hypothetical protein VLH60_07590, partial [Sedimentisphaerales bacterium]|nr:hypothetical protein [Sedimentisphaerales bacterium]
GKYEQREINDIANMAFISGRANREISKKAPDVYLPAVVKERGVDALRLQCVPDDASLYSVHKYREFIEKRRALLVDCVEKFVNSALVR